MSESRTKKSVLNIQIALAFYFLNLILRFFSRKIFLDYLGTEVLGLNTTAQNLLGFLNIAELGIKSSVATTLYAPLYNKDYRKINDIISLQGWLYRNVAYIVIGGACILMCFFPLIFSKAQVPMWYVYASFGAFLYSSLLSYFVNYKQILFSADQKEYKNTIQIQGWTFIKVLLQMFAVATLSNGYVWWVIIEVVITTCTAFTLNRSINHEYSWLKTSVKNGNALRKQYPEIVTKIKQVFFHKIGGFVLTQTSPLIIYAYASLTLVAIYGNYMIIILGITMLMQAMFNSITAGVGNLVAEKDEKKIQAIFWELTIERIWIAAIICFIAFETSDIFISAWIGPEYILETNAFIVLIITTFIQLTRTNEIFIAAYGMFQDIGAPVIEAILNLGLSILLGYFWGLTGVLSGVLISQLIIVVGWKSYFLYHHAFKRNIAEYSIKYIKYIIIVLGSAISLHYTIPYIYYPKNQDFLNFIIYALITGITYSILITAILLACDIPMRNSCKRIISIIKRI